MFVSYKDSFEKQYFINELSMDTNNFVIKFDLLILVVGLTIEI